MLLKLNLTIYMKTVLILIAKINLLFKYITFKLTPKKKKFQIHLPENYLF